MKNKKLGFETRAIHAGQNADPVTGAIMTPVYMSSTYVQSSPGVHKGYEYTRTSNPTRRAYEDCLASLEEGVRGFAFASGCAATTTILHMLSSGDHIIAADDLYGGTVRLFDRVFKQMGIEVSYVKMTDLKLTETAVRKNTKMFWLETPTNPLLQVIDIKKICALAKKVKALSVVDNTFMSPYFQKPLTLGADIVMHSATKYIGGHSDLLGGAIVTSTDALAEKIQFLTNSLGGVCSNMDSFLFLRSLKTLPIRMRAHEANAKKLADFLTAHSKVERVIYPGLKSHPQHKIASQQASGFGGMITIYVKGGLKGAKKILENVKIFQLAESLGGVESLIEHPALMTHLSIPKERREKIGVHDNLVRLSVGIESIEDLIQDLDSALR